MSILAIRSDCSWFRHEIVLTKWWIVRLGSDFALKLLWKSQLLTKTMNQNRANGVTGRQGKHTIGESALDSAFLFLARLSSSFFQCYFMWLFFIRFSRSWRSLAKKQSENRKFLGFRTKKIDSPSKNRSDSCLKSVSVGFSLLGYSQWTYKDETLRNIEIPLAKCNREIRSIENLAPRIGGSRYWQNVWIT